MDAKTSADQAFLNSIEEQLEKACYSGDQMAIFNLLAEKISKFVCLSKLEVRGFLIAAIRKWEIESGLKFGDMRKVPPPEKIKVVSRIFELLKQDLADFVESTKKRELFGKEVHNVLEFYIAEYSERPVHM